jgi:voltage-gated potassium channel
MQRQRWYALIEGGFAGSLAARVVAASIVVLIVANTVAVVLESDAQLFAQWRSALLSFEALSIAVFTGEYLLRVWVAPEHPRFHGLPAWRARLRYLGSPIAIIDLIAIAPAYLAMFVAMDLRYLRLLRLLRLLKLTHYFSGLGIFLAVVRAQSRTLLSVVFTIVILVVVAAGLMYALEHQAQPQAFGSIGQSAWWAVVTMTTVGYGDVTPITAVGRVLATLIMLLGVGIVALPAAMLAARFAEELQGRRDELAAKLDVAMGDGQLDQLEFGEIAELSRELGVPRETLDRMLHARSVRRLLVPTCPHCGKSID